MPVVGALARKAGTTLACNADAERLLSAGELVGVLPEGFKGIGKPFRERYKLQRFGRGGFVSAALRTGVPIIPCSIVGAEEIYPMIGNAKTLARLLGLPVLPDHADLPAGSGRSAWSRCRRSGSSSSASRSRPASYGPGAAEDPMLVFNLTDQVRETIQQTLYRLLLQRTQRLRLTPRRRPAGRGMRVHGGATADARDASAAATLAGPASPQAMCRWRRPRRRAVTRQDVPAGMSRRVLEGPAVAAAEGDRAADDAAGERGHRRGSGTPIFAALRPVRKSRISQPRARATARSSVSGLTATAVPTRTSIGRSLAESL